MDTTLIAHVAALGGVTTNDFEVRASLRVVVTLALFGKRDADATLVLSREQARELAGRLLEASAPHVDTPASVADKARTAADVGRRFGEIR